MCECARLTQAATVARYRHEGPQGAADDTVRPAEGGLLERAGVLVQEGVHAVGGGGASISHEGLWEKKEGGKKNLVRRVKLIGTFSTGLQWDFI